MKLKILFVLFFACVSLVFSQNTLTVGEVYDFNIGDIFQRNSGVNTPPVYSQITITNKTYSPLSDTVFYEYDLLTYYSAACPPPCAPYYTSSSGNTVFYTNLSDTIGNECGVQPLDMNCIDTTGYTGSWIDSSYYDSQFCNREMIYISLMGNGPVPSDSCFIYFEPHFGHLVYGKGLGIVDDYYNTCAEGNPNCATRTSLTYYKKGIDSCGLPNVLLSNISSISESSSAKSTLLVYPNPCSDFVNFSSIVQAVEIVNVYGQVVKKMEHVSRVDLRELLDGVYFVRIKENGSTNGVEKKIIKYSQN